MLLPWINATPMFWPSPGIAGGDSRNSQTVVCQLVDITTRGARRQVTVVIRGRGRAHSTDPGFRFHPDSTARSPWNSQAASPATACDAHGELIGLANLESG